MNIEIELRYQVLDQSEVWNFVRQLNFINKKRVLDCYLDTQDADLMKRGIYVRIRNENMLDIKFNRDCLKDPNLELQPYCEEYSFEIPFSPQSISQINKLHDDLGLKNITFPDLENYKKINNLIDHRTVDKIRSSYNHEEFVIVIDDVKELGLFLEIEMLTSSADNIDFVKEEMQKVLMNLTLKPLETGYDTLMLRKHNFKQYMQSRFVLKEDRDC